MNLDSLRDNYRLALSIIGAECAVYNHFSVYAIPNDTGHGMMDSDAKQDIENFLSRVESHYKSSKSINLDYGNDLKEQNSTKRFVLRKARDNEEANIQSGLEWVEEFMSK